MTAEAIIQQIRNGQVSPVYILHGEEPFYLDSIVHVLENEVLDESAKGFDFQMVYGKDVSATDMIDMLRRFPMMSPKQMIILKEAQHFVGLDKLQAYIESPSPTSIFVVVHSNKSLDKRSAFYKSAQKHTVSFESEKVKDYKLQEWIRNHVRSLNATIQDKAVALLDDHIGNDLKRIHSAIQMVLLNLDVNHIDEDAIEKYVGVSKEFNGFELSNAVLQGNLTKAYRIIQYFEHSKSNGLIAQLALLYGTFNRLSLVAASAGKSDAEIAKTAGIAPFLVKDYKSALNRYPIHKIESSFHILYEYDLKAKGVIPALGNEYELLQEMIGKLLR